MCYTNQQINADTDVN